MVLKTTMNKKKMIKECDLEEMFLSSKALVVQIFACIFLKVLGAGTDIVKY